MTGRGILQSKEFQEKIKKGCFCQAEERDDGGRNQTENYG